MANKILDLCNKDGEDNNMWFVIVVIGVIGLNLILTITVLILLATRGGGAQKNSDDSDLEGGKKATLGTLSSVAKKATHATEHGSGGDGGKDMKGELLKFSRQLEAMDRKIDNKRVNEITASYMLHNAHDAIGNRVPTAAQVSTSLARLPLCHFLIHSNTKRASFVHTLSVHAALMDEWSVRVMCVCKCVNVNMQMCGWVGMLGRMCVHSCFVRCGVR